MECYLTEELPVAIAFLQGVFTGIQAEHGNLISRDTTGKTQVNTFCQLILQFQNVDDYIGAQAVNLQQAAFHNAISKNGILGKVHIVDGQRAFIIHVNLGTHQIVDNQGTLTLLAEQAGGIVRREHYIGTQHHIAAASQGRNGSRGTFGAQGTACQAQHRGNRGTIEHVEHAFIHEHRATCGHRATDDESAGTLLGQVTVVIVAQIAK